MKDLKNSLAIWQLSSEGKSIPLVHERVLTMLETMYPGRWGQDVLDLLMGEGWVKCTVYGSYELTPKGLKERATLPQEEACPPPIQKPKVPDVNPWGTFRKLVGYYADCVRQQEKSQQYLFNGDYGKKYFLPVLPYGWLKELGDQVEEFSVPQSKDNNVAINTILTRREYEDDVYIGYPIEAFYKDGKTHYVPIALIPVDVRNDRNNLYITPRLDEADINHTWLEYHVANQNHQLLLDLLTRLHRDDKYQGLIDIKLSLPYLEQYARGCKPGMFDPNNLTWVLPRLAAKGSCSCNCAALFVGSDPKYSRTLIRELRYIVKEPDEVLDTTALAYVFREPALQAPAEQKRYAFPLIKTNDEQQLAITQALESPITLVTGPPGTGKSQVAVNIIANYVLRKRSVLFTSKNHKAVHAIADRSASLLQGYSMNLVNFCSTPDGAVTEEWFKKDPQLLLAQAAQDAAFARREHHDDALDMEEKWLDIISHFKDRDELETELSKIQARIEELDDHIHRFLNVKDRTQAICYPEISILKRIKGQLADKPTAKGLRGLLAKLKWKFRDSRRNDSARKEAAAIMPTKVKSALTSGYIKKEVERLIENIQNLKKLSKEKKRLCQQCEKLMPLAEGRESIQEEVTAVDDKLITALLYAMTEATKPYREDDKLVRQLKNLQAEFRTQNKLLTTQGVNAKQVQQHVLMFRRFLEVAPAWATTLLSLTRSAPCLPAVYDTVIIDEASQCDVPPMIPALYRAKRAVIVGDPQQFPPVITMRPARNEYLLSQHQLTDIKYAIYNYSTASAYSVVHAQRVMLTNHYRCHPDIADYFNECFYNNRLNVCTEAIDILKGCGKKAGVDWIDIPNSIAAEMDAVVKRVAELAALGFKGSVGVITPLREYAQALDERLNLYRNCFDGELIVNTVNGFQGGEKDVIIFMLSYTGELKQGQRWYLTAEQNRYIYNVAVSRARMCLVLVGDRTRCEESSYTLLRKLAAMPRPPQPAPDIPKFDSVWEERLYRELVKVGIKPQTQYHLVGRRLDMAVLTDSVKLDIEVDGVRWHTAASGGRKIDDFWRDIQVNSAGWKIIRFWVYELERDMAGCVQKVKEILQDGN